jgi:hypothetical protein
LWRIAGRRPKRFALRANSFGNVSATGAATTARPPWHGTLIVPVA